MQFPINPEIEQAIIDLLYAQGGPDYQMYLEDIYEPLADYFNLTHKQRVATSIEVTGRGENRSYWENRVRTAKARLIDKGVLYPKLGDGLCKLQDVAAVSANAKGAKRVNQTPVPAITSTVVAVNTPLAQDLSEPPDTIRSLSTTYRILRDTALARRIKALHSYKCQICDETIRLSNGQYYAEAHHIKPLGPPHSGPDIEENIICVCPNHHVQLDYRSIQLDLSELKTQKGHTIGQEYIDYHNTKIYNK